MEATKTINKHKTVSLVSLRLVKERDIAFEEVITDPDIAARLLHPFFKDLDREAFYVLCLSHAKKPLSVNMVSLGSLTASLCEPREVFKTAILSNASSIIVAHNHPSGNPDASAADINITHKLNEVGKVLGIHLDDHLIFHGETPKDFKSLKSENYF